MEQLKLDEFLNYRFISGLSLYNNKLFFVLSKAKEDKLGYEKDLYMYDGSFKRLTQSGKVSNYCTIDDRILYETGKNNGELEFNYLNINSGFIKEAFKLPLLDAKIKMIKDKMAIVSTTKKDGYETSDYYEILDENPFWFNGSGFINGNRSSLFIMDKDDPSSLKKVTSSLFNVDKIEISGDYIYILGEEYKIKPSNFPKIYSYNINLDELKLVYESDEIHIQDICTYDNGLYVFGSDQKTWGINENDKVYKLEDGNLSLYFDNVESFDSSVGSDCRLCGYKKPLSFNNDIYYLSTRFNSSHLFKFNGKEQQISLNDDGSIDDFALDENNIYYVGMLDNKLQEIYTIKEGKQIRLSNFNEDVLKGKYVADYNEITCMCHNTKIYGWVLLPKDYNPTKKYPAILDVHGGPKTVYGKVFYHEMQYWANKGYFVMFSNPIGSDGRGNEFMHMSGKYGTKDYDCLMNFVDVILDKYPAIDKNRVCETGGSYGGFMTNWIIGHTDRFCACASQRSISDWLSFGGTSDIGYRFDLDQMNVENVIDCESTLWSFSPLKYANNCKTPTLFIHSDEDYRCPIGQGLEMMNALIENGVETRMCYFHHENHELSRGGKPINRIKRLEEITAWFDKHSKE